MRCKRLRQLMLTSCCANEYDKESGHVSIEKSTPVVEKTKKAMRIKLCQLELLLEPCCFLGDGDGKDALSEDINPEKAPSLLTRISQTLWRNIRGETLLHIAAIKV